MRNTDKLIAAMRQESGTDCKTRGTQCVDRIGRIFRTATGRRIALAKLLPEFADAETAITEDYAQ